MITTLTHIFFPSPGGGGGYGGGGGSGGGGGYGGGGKLLLSARSQLSRLLGAYPYPHLFLFLQVDMVEEVADTVVVDTVEIITGTWL